MTGNSKFKKFLIHMDRYFVLGLSILLLAFSVRFIIGSWQFKSRLISKNPDLFKSGEIVKIEKVVDADEMSVSNKAGKRTLVRLLGIKSFDPFAGAFLFPRFGEQCFNFIKSNYEGKKAKIILMEKAKDKRGRLLAYVHVDSGRETEKYSVDIAKEILKRGLTMVYTRYEFSREKEYLKIEHQAVNSGLGIWSHEKSRSLAISLKQMWYSERKR
ncbi:MAG: thermonuclease family protein [Deltaproteobacteria bacterium]|nr:thermonuclease family protein [Deltaproteobacteria bacterium]